MPGMHVQAKGDTLIFSRVAGTLAASLFLVYAVADGMDHGGIPSPSILCTGVSTCEGSTVTKQEGGATSEAR